MSNKHALVALLAAATAGLTAFIAVFVFDQRNGPPIVIRDPIAETEFVIWIGGAIEEPGVYTLPAGSRLNDAIQVAGGLTDDADTSALNLAERLADEARIDIPALVPTPAAGAGGTPISIPPAATRVSEPRDNRIDINTADAATLESLPGIGPVIAARIVDYRNEHGPFERIEDLATVNGVSARMVESLRDQITAGR